ncbi:MAG: hypothetical protein RIB59_04560 [Rhodospirillales bacterium]
MDLRLVVDNANEYVNTPWSKAEIKLFEDIADLRRQSGSDSRMVHGCSEDNRPWISVINDLNGRISIHCTRHTEGGYIILGENRGPTYWRNLVAIGEKLLTAKCVS